MNKNCSSFEFAELVVVVFVVLVFSYGEDYFTSREHIVSTNVPIVVIVAH